MTWATTATVFSCVASRNKRMGAENLRFEEPRGPDASPSGGSQRSQAHCGHSRASGPQKLSPSHRPAVMFGLSPIPPKPLRGLDDEAGDLKVAGARLIHRPILGSSSSARPPRAAMASLSPRTAILRIALLALPQSTVPCAPHCGPTAAPLSLRHVFARLTRLLLSNKSRPPWRERVRRAGAPFG